MEILTDIIKDNYSYWESECKKEDDKNAELSSPNSSVTKKDTEDSLNSSSSKKATPSIENNTLTLVDTSPSKKENEENECEANKAA